jgi:hypothetical protein
MRQSRKPAPSANEPMGIVIADGGAPTTETRFLAYVWGPVPDLEATLSSDTAEFAAAL